MKKLLYILIVPLFFIACEKDEPISIVPSDISNVRSDSLPGQIILRWDMPSDTQSIHYIEVSYFDHRLEKKVINLSSCDSLLVDKTRNKYGDYEFELTPYSITRTPGTSFQHKAISGHAPIKEIYLSEEEIIIEESQIETNSLQDNNNNPPTNLFDDDENTIYHSRWRKPIPDIAWLSFDLKKEIKAFKINWGPRTNNVQGKPVDVDLYGSIDGEDWFLIINLTKEKDGLPDTTTDWFRSPMYKSNQPFRHLKYSVNKTNNNSKWWNMSEIEILKVELEVINPEAPDYEE